MLDLTDLLDKLTTHSELIALIDLFAGFVLLYIFFKLIFKVKTNKGKIFNFIFSIALYLPIIIQIDKYIPSAEEQPLYYLGITVIFLIFLIIEIPLLFKLKHKNKRKQNRPKKTKKNKPVKAKKKIRSESPKQPKNIPSRNVSARGKGFSSYAPTAPLPVQNESTLFHPINSYEEEYNIPHRETLNEYLEEIDSMSAHGEQFEIFCKNLLIANGFKKVQTTRLSGDYGVDILAEKEDITYAIQCKCYSSPVGNKAVQEAYSGKSYYNRMVAVVLTNNYFTSSAIETANANSVLLWDRDKLIKLLLVYLQF